MRKVLSFVLVLAMVLGCVSMAFAANVSDVKGTKYENAVNALTELGVISGYGDGTYKPENQVTRAQFVALLVKALGYKPVKTATPFKDVPADNQYSGYIAVAYALGITGGKTKDTFGPNDPVTYNQAIAFIVRGMGYTNEALKALQGNYSYPLSEIVQAQALKMFEHCDTTGNTPATRGDYALFLYDVLAKHTCVAQNTGDVRSWNTNGPTLLSKLGVTEETTARVIDGTEVAVDGLNLAPYIGKSVIAYGKTIDSIYKIIAVKEVKSTALTGKLDAAKTTLTVGSDKYTLITGATATSVAAFVNGGLEATNAWTSAAVATSYTFEVEVSGKQISKVYSYSTWTVSNAAKVTAAQLEQLKKEKDQKNLLGQFFATDTSYEIDTTKFELVGVDSLADIAKDNVVYVYTNPYTTKVSKVVVGTTVVEGLVSRKDGSKYTIANAQYELEATATGANNTAVEVSNTVKAYLDGYGKVYYATKVSGTAKTLAVVLDAANGIQANWATGTDAKAAKVKLYNLADGTVKDVELVSDGTVAEKTTNLITTTYDAILTKGAVVKYDLDTDGKLCVATQAGTFTTATAITKNGYVGNYKIADDAIVVAVDETYAVVASAAGFKFTNVTDAAFDADFKLSKKASVLNTDKSVAYMKDTTTGYITLLFIADTATASTDKTYKTISASGEKDVDGKKTLWVSFFGDSEEYPTTATTVDEAAKKELYEVKFNAAGKAVLADNAFAVNTNDGFAVTTSEAVGTTYFAFVLDDNGLKNIAKNADSTSTAAVTHTAIVDTTVFLKWNATKKAYEAGSKSDLTSKLTEAKFYKTNTEEQYATFVLYTLY